MAPTIKSGRGIYHLKSAAAPEQSGSEWVLTVALDRADGIERVAMRCRVAAPSADSGGEHTAIAAVLARIAPMIERDFEHLREEALKSIRVERRLFEVAFDAPER